MLKKIKVDVHQHEDLLQEANSDLHPVIKRSNRHFGHSFFRVIYLNLSL